MARGRPVSETQTWDCQVHLRLRVGEDDDLIAFLKSIPARRRATAIKATLRTGGMIATQPQAADSDDDMLTALDDFLK